MRMFIWKTATIVAIAGGLSACGSDTATAPPTSVTPPPATAKVEDGFGANFGIAYRADANSIAKDPVAGDIAPLDLTKDATTL